MEYSTANISVSNAGLVLLSSYYPVLFARTGLSHDFSFTDIESQARAAHYLQYIATGHIAYTPGELALNNILCGIAAEAAGPAGMDISEDHKIIMSSLIDAAISHWTVIGESSQDAFRGNWLVRNGMLTETEHHWELLIEKRAYDVLIHHAPFSFSLIRYPWMKKELRVLWAY